MWEELAEIGVQPLRSEEEVDAVLGAREGTALLVINSVCGCAAGGCRPGVTLALQNERIPDRLGTVFAGVDTEATERAREYLPYPPSSPNIVLFKNGEPIIAMQRSHIEVMSPVQIANALVEAFNTECTRKGPSVDQEIFDQHKHVKRCGSSIPLYSGE
jgi:putative YphP/YqiW family bacilliredoxin